MISFFPPLNSGRAVPGEGGLAGVTGVSQGRAGGADQGSWFTEGSTAVSCACSFTHIPYVSQSLRAELESCSLEAEQNRDRVKELAQAVQDKEEEMKIVEKKSNSMVSGRLLQHSHTPSIEQCNTLVRLPSPPLPSPPLLS